MGANLKNTDCCNFRVCFVVFKYAVSYIKACISDYSANHQSTVRQGVGSTARIHGHLLRQCWVREGSVRRSHPGQVN